MVLLVYRGSGHLRMLNAYTTNSHKEMYEEASQVASDAVGSIRTVASFTAEGEVMEIYKKKCKRLVTASIQNGLVSGTGFGLSYFIMFSVYATSFYAGARLIQDGKTTFTDVFRVAEESIKIYNAISYGTTNLVDKFFEMQRHDAVRALEIYRRAGQQAERLSQFYEICRSIDIRRGEKFIKIEQPPASFLTALEEYVKEAPRASTVRKDQVIDEKPNVVLAIEYKETFEVEEPAKPPSPPAEPVKEEIPVPEQPDLLGLNEINPDASELDNRNALALAIVPVDSQSTPNPAGSFSSMNGTTGWELALVTAPSSNETVVTTSELGGGLNKLTLDSLYDDAIRRANQPTSYNPWEMPPATSPYMQPVVHDPFYASNAVAAPHHVQMAAMAQQQQALMLQQQMMMMGQQANQTSMNPFGNPYGSVGMHQYGTGMPVQASNTYTGLI